jgi:radical SAM protein with 4Fe4S-binding SPASM domain
MAPSAQIIKVAKKYLAWGQSKNLRADQIHVHGCINKFSLPYTKQSYDYLRELGFNNIWFMPVHEVPWDQNDLDIFEVQYRLIADRIYHECVDNQTSLPFDSFASFKCVTESQAKGCSAGSTMLTFDTDGTLYPCHKFKFPEGKRLVIGHIDKGIDKSATLDFEQTQMTNMFGAKNCGECESKSCRVCIAQNYEYHGDIRQGFPKYCRLSLKENEIRWTLRNRLVEAGILQPIIGESYQPLNYPPPGDPTTIDGMIDIKVDQRINFFVSDIYRNLGIYQERLGKEVQIYMDNSMKSIQQLIQVCKGMVEGMEELADRVTTIEEHLKKLQ